MNRQQKKVLIILSIIGVIYFFIFIPPNSVGSADRNMLSVFEIDEYALYGFNIRMLEFRDNIKESLWEFIAYEHYNYGFPFHFFSALVMLPLKLTSSDLYTTPNIMLALRQIVSIIPMLLAILVMVYLQTKFKSLWKSLTLFLFLLSIPAVFKNNFWWHPESLTFLFIALTFFFLNRDDLSFKRNFYYAAIACGLAVGTKLIGLFFFLSIPTYIVWGYFAKRIDIKTAFVRSLQFVGLMFAVFLISNPWIIFPGPRAAGIKIHQRLAAGLSYGWTVEYSKGPLAWFEAITKNFGEGFSIIFAYIILIIGTIRGPRRLFNTLILTWAVPFSLYLFFNIAIKPSHFYMPIALPVYSCIAILFSYLDKKQTDHFPPKAYPAVRVISLLALSVFCYQFILNVAWDVEEYNQQLQREENSEAIKFYSMLEKDYLDHIPEDIHLVISHDRSIYIPISPRWHTSITRSLVDYEYIQETNFHFLLLSQQRIKEYTQPDSLETATNKNEMILAHEFFTDALNNEVEGYELLYKNHFGIVYIREDLYKAYFSEN